MRGAVAISTGRRRTVPGAWHKLFNSALGVTAALVLDYSGAVGGKFFANNNNNLTFDDLHTYTGASLATQKDSAGLVVYKPHNLQVNSEKFQEATWSKNRVTVNLNATLAPDGSMTAEEIVEDGTESNTHRIVDSFTTVQGETRSNGVYVKAGVGSRHVYIRVIPDNTSNNPRHAYMNPTTGALGTVESPLTATVTDVGNGWHYFQVEFDTESVGYSFVIGLADADNSNSYNGDGASSLFFWGAQVNLLPMAAANDTFATTYVPTTATAVFQHRLDHDSSGNRIGLLIEETRTNLCLWSDDWTNAAYNTVTNMTVLKDQTGADGASNSASSLLATAANAIITQSITNASAVRVYSVHVKRLVGTGNIEMTQDGGSTWADVKASINTSTYTQVGVVKATVTNPVVGFRIVTDTDKIAVQYGDSEIGAFATSPIPTTTVAVTRATETCSVAVSSWGYVGTSGTHYASYNVTPGLQSDSLAHVVLHQHIDASNFIRLFKAAGNKDQYIYREGGTDLAKIIAANALSGDVKIAGAYLENTFAYYRNGTQIGVDTSGTPTITPTNLFIGSDNGGTQVLNDHIKAVAYYPTRLSNTDLVGLTT